MAKIRVLLANQPLLFRHLLRELLSRESDFHVVDESANPAEWLKRSRTPAPECVLADAGSSFGQDEGLRSLAADWPQLLVLALSPREPLLRVFHSDGASESHEVASIPGALDLMRRLVTKHREEMN